MKKANWFFVLIGILILFGFVYLISPKIEQKGFEVEVLAGNLDTPWAIDFLPNGNMIFTERHGRVRDIAGHNGYLYIATSNKDGRGIPKINDDKIIRVKLP